MKKLIVTLALSVLLVGCGGANATSEQKVVLVEYPKQPLVSEFSQKEHDRVIRLSLRDISLERKRIINELDATSGYSDEERVAYRLHVTKMYMTYYDYKSKLLYAVK